MSDKPKVLPDLTQKHDPVLLKLQQKYLRVCEQQRQRKEIYGEDLHYRYFETQKNILKNDIAARIKENETAAAVYHPEADEKVVAEYLKLRNEVFESNTNLPVVFNPPPKVYKDKDRKDLHTPIKSRVRYKQRRKHPADDPPPYDNAIKYRGHRTSDPRWRNHRKRPTED